MSELEIGEVQINSSLYELKEFSKSGVWDDLQREIRVWIENLKNDLLSPDTDDMSEIHRIRGRIQALDAVLQMPINLVEALEADIERDKRNG